MCIGTSILTFGITKLTQALLESSWKVAVLIETVRIIKYRGAPEIGEGEQARTPARRNCRQYMSGEVSMNVAFALERRSMQPSLQSTSSHSGDRECSRSLF